MANAMLKMVSDIWFGYSRDRIPPEERKRADEWIQKFLNLVSQSPTLLLTDKLVLSPSHMIGALGKRYSSQFESLFPFLTTTQIAYYYVNFIDSWQAFAENIPSDIEKSTAIHKLKDILQLLEKEQKPLFIGDDSIKEIKRLDPTTSDFLLQEGLIK